MFRSLIFKKIKIKNKRIFIILTSFYELTYYVEFLDRLNELVEIIGMPFVEGPSSDRYTVKEANHKYYRYGNKRMFVPRRLDVIEKDLLQ